MKTTLPSLTERKSKADADWLKTPYPNLIRYKPSGTYFGRVRVNGKLIRRSLETHVLSVAKVKLSDFLQDYRRLTINKGRSVKGEVIIELFRKEIEDDANNQPRTKLYKREVLIALKKTWPELYSSEIARISQKDCNDWAARHGKDYSPTRFNGALGIVRRIFDIAVEHGYRVDNPAKFVDRRRVKPKELHLPSQAQFQEMVRQIQSSGAGQANDCANLFRFLAFSGVRINEARHVVWADADFQKQQLCVRVTKNSKARWIPFNESLRDLLTRLRAARPDESPESPVMRVFECQKSIDRAAKLVGVGRITHHDLRHLFATRCIEAGVDIPTVSRWLGHQDGGALCMKTYGHLRDQHSLEMAKLVSFTSGNATSVPSSAPQNSPGANVNKISAVIDKSLLQEICELPEEKLDAAFNALLGRYVLVVPEILVEEVWVNWANPGGSQNPKVVENMTHCLLHLRDAWIADPLEIAFLELVRHESIDVLPRPPQKIMDSFFNLRRDDPATVAWFKKWRELNDEIIRNRVQEHANIIDTDEFAKVADERDFVTRFIRPKFVEMLMDPSRKRKLLEATLGLTFRKRHPEFSKEIDTAFESYSPETFDKYHATFNCIMAPMFYFYAALCEIAVPGGENRRIIGRNFRRQRNNLSDEKYVESALLMPHEMREVSLILDGTLYV